MDLARDDQMERLYTDMQVLVAVGNNSLDTMYKGGTLVARRRVA